MRTLQSPVVSVVARLSPMKIFLLAEVALQAALYPIWIVHVAPVASSPACDPIKILPVFVPPPCPA